MDEADNSGYIMPGLSGYQNEPQYESSDIDSDNNSGVESESDESNVGEDGGHLPQRC
jgi:hypothetical protein